ncbi:unnamed protein product [Aphanomyces euteiches]
MSTAFPLHKAIWDGNAIQVEEILQYADCDELNPREKPILLERDLRGNTPLMLALRCAHASQLPIIRILLKYGANVLTRDAMGWSCIQNATLCDNDDVLTEIFLQAEKQTYENLRARSIALYSILHDIPDFYVEIKIELTSWIPLVSRALPSDTLKIWKKGPYIRCDFTIKDFHNTSWKRGRMTHLLRTFENQPGEVLLIDHDTKSALDVSKVITAHTKADIDTSLEMLYTCKMSTYDMDIAKIDLKHKKEMIKKKTAGMPGKKYEMQHATVKLRLRGAAQPNWSPEGSQENRDNNSLAKAKKFFAHLTPTKTSKKTPQSSSPENTVLVTPDSPVEMHLQVQPGDCLHWEYTSSVAGAVHCKATLFANNTVTYVSGPPLAIQDHGLVVLTWTNTTKKKAVITHHIVHQRQVESQMDHGLSPRRGSTATDGLPTPPMPVRVPNPRMQTTAFHDYFDSDPEMHHSFRGLTVPPDERSFTKELKGTVTMSESFAFQVADFLPVAQFLSSRSEQFDTLREFFEMKLPPGFPIKFQLPMMLSVRGSYTFVNAGPCTADDYHFAIPSTYTRL